MRFFKDNNVSSRWTVTHLFQSEPIILNDKIFVFIFGAVSLGLLHVEHCQQENISHIIAPSDTCESINQIICQAFCFEILM